jgi:hypothetical protein
MGAIVSCPECGRRLQVPEGFFGKKVRCPDCKQTFVAQPSAETGVQASGPGLTRPGPPPVREQPAEEAHEDDRPRRRSWEDEDEENDEDRPRRRRRLRRNTRQAQMILVLVFGISSASMAAVGLCCNLFTFVGLGLGIAGTVMGFIEMAAIRSGRAPEESKAMVLTGLILSIVGIVLALGLFLLTCMMVGVNLGLQGAFG